MLPKWMIVVLSISIFGVAKIVRSHAQDSEMDAGIELLNPLSVFDPSSLVAFRERPLFAPSRRAAPEPVPADEPVATLDVPSLNIRLLGVVKSPKGTVAFLEDQDNGARQSVRAGENYQDWKVDRVDESGLTLRRNGESVSFDIFSANPAPSPSVPTANAPVAPVADAISQIQPPPRKVRIIEPTASSGDSGAADSAAEARDVQDLIDFFGPTAQPAR